MNILIDTHIALWATAKSELLTDKMRELLEDENNTIFYSIVSVWETMLKHSSHPNDFTLTDSEFDALCEQTGFLFLELKREHIYAVNTLVYPDDAVEKHKDPFDRLLLAQAKQEGFMFMTHDHKISLYKEDCIIHV